MFNHYESTKRWSIRKLSVGVASVVVASGMVLLSNPVLAEETVTDMPNMELVAELPAPIAVESDVPMETPVVATEIPLVEPVATPEEVVAAVDTNIKDSVEVPASFLEKAESPGPFTAGVNQVIPYEFFGGDGMLTRLLLKEADKAPWSDNGTAKNQALLPIEKVGKGHYFYDVKLDGPALGKMDAELLQALKQAGNHTYKGTVTVYGAKDGMADLTNVVASKVVSVQTFASLSADKVQKAVAENIKDKTEVPASFLEKANHPGPFTAGVNQIIPFEFFGGDGMLTRWLLNGADKAPWSDNGTAMNPLLSPAEGLGKGQLFYEVAIQGDLAGKTGQELLDALKANGAKTYTAIVKVYDSKDGKPETSKVVAIKEITFNIEKAKENNLGMKDTPSQDTMANEMTPNMDATPEMKKDMVVEKEMTPKSQMMSKGETPHVTMMSAKADKMMLPSTGEEQSRAGLIGLLSIMFASFVGLIGLRKVKN